MLEWWTALHTMATSQSRRLFEAPSRIHPTHIALLLLLYSSSCVRYALSSSGAAQQVQHLCKPQDGLPLSPPFTAPETGLIPLCTQYSCSCCNRTHALTLYRSLYSAMEDAAFSRDCAAWLTTMACRVCDPEVGVGLKPDVCPGTCRAWHNACKDEFFAFDSRANQLVPCPEGSAEGLLICSKLEAIAADGQQLCELAGLTVARRDSPACFSGASSHRTDICIPSQASKGPAQEQKTRGSQKSSRRSKKSKGSGGPSANISLAAAIGVIFAVFVPVVLLLRRFLQRGALAAPLEEGPWANLGQGHKLGTKQD